MKLDSSAAWQDASQMVSANRDILVVLCGVFMFLPSLVTSLMLGDPPQPSAEADPKALLAMMGTFYKAAAPYILIGALIQLIGQLAITRLIAGRPGCTVGEALAEAVRNLPVQIGVQVLILVTWMLVGGLVVGLGAATGSVALTALLLIATVALAVWAGARLMMVLPLTAVEGMRNPVAIIRRSWELTRGNAGAILLFILLMALVMMIVVLVGSAVTGVIAALLMGGKAAAVLGGAVQSVIGAGFALYLTAAIAAIHRQLAPGKEALQSPFV